MIVTEAVWVGGSILSLLTLGALSCCCGGTQQQQQQIVVGENDEAKRVCPECGMENPREANHCGDCGFAFKSNNGE